MAPIVEQLLILQDRDSRLAKLKAELGRIPVEVAAVDARVKQETARLDQMKNESKQIESERKKLELDAESKRAQAAKYRTQSALIKSNTEYQALLKEIAKAESEIQAIEDRELELMDTVEKRQPAIKEEQALVAEVTGKVNATKSELQQRAAAMESEMTKLKVEREELAKLVDEDVLSRYQRLIKSKGDVAVVPIRNGNCGGCHLHIPPQLAHDAKGGNGLVSCDNCGRILFWPTD